VEIPTTEFATPHAFIFLHENSVFLTFRNRTVSSWNIRGQCIRRCFEDHLMFDQCTCNNICVNSSQTLIVSYCQDPKSSIGM